MAAEEKLGVPSNEFFAAVKYHAVGSLQDQSEELLKAGGATAKAYLSDDVTHCLAGQAAEEDVLQEASEIYEIPVIRGDAWVQKSIKCGKPLPLSVFDAVPSSKAFFKGLHFSLSGLSYKDMSNIWTIVSAYGGTLSRELRVKTTHLICGTKSGLKYEKAEKVIKVTPDFILECVRAKCLVPAETFHPRLLLRPGEIWEKPQAKKVKKKRPETELSQVSQVTEPSVPQVPVPPVTTANPQVSTGQLAGQNNVPRMSPPNVSQPMSHGQLPAGQNNVPRMSQPIMSQAGQNNVPRMSQPNPMQMGPRPHMTQAGQRPPMSMGQRPPMSQVSQVPPGQNPQMSQAGHQMNPQLSQAGHMPANPQMSQAGQNVPMSQAGQMSTLAMSQAGQMPTPAMSQAPGQMPNMSQANQMPANSQPGQMPPQMSQANQMPPQMSQANQMQQQMGQPGQMSHQMGQQPQMSQAGPMPMQQQQQQQPGQYPQQQTQQMMQYQQQQNPQQYPQQQQQQQYQWQGQQQQQYQGQYPQQQQQQQTWQQQQPQQQQQPPRPSNPIMLRQQQLIHQHIASLSIEDRAKFTSMTPHEKQEYLAQRNLLVTNQMMQQTTIVLTDQQREQLQHMDQPQKAAFIQRLRQQQAIRQQQQQQQYQQQPQPQVPQQNYQVRPPHSSPQLPNPQLSPGNRPQWSGETHPALAQVPRTPQQLQHLQRLQMQREQQQLSPNQQQMVRPQLPQQPGVPQPQVPNQVPGQNGSQQKTKVALQNMLSNRAMSPQSVVAGQPQPQSPQRLQMPQPQQPPVIPQPQQQMQPQQPPQPVPQVPQAQPQVPQPQMFNPQSQRPQFMQPQQQPMVQPQVAVQRPAGVPQGPMMVAQPQPQPHIRYGPPGGPPMQPAVPQPVARPPMTPQPPRPPMPRPMFLGHQPGNNLPPDLCLLGCIFFICDYQDDLEDSKFCDDWKKVIRQFGGEVVDAYHAGITHVLCKSQDSNLANQALREGKRLVTVYWLNDIVVKRVVLPPWKAIHFPLPANFERPCENMILTLTGFEGRDRDWVKEMIRITGAKYTSYFTKHNHAIICKSCEGDKYAKAKEWKVPTVSIQWLNDVFFGSMNAVQCMNNPKYQNFRAEDPFKIEYSLVPNLMASWKNPIRITPETFNKVKANPPARIKRKAEKKRLEEEEAKRLRRADENQSAIDPTTGQFIPPNQSQQNPQQSSTELTEVKNEVKSPEIKSEPNGKMNGVKENGDNCDDNDKDEKNESKLKIMLSGFVESEKEELTGLAQGLGMELTDIAQKATHLVMPKLGRTISFLCAINYVKYILKADWIRESSKEKKVLDVKDYRLQDSDFEKTFGCNLTKMLAKQDRHKLFEGRTFYLTPSIKPTWKQLKLVIECAGGKVENKRRKKVDEIREITGNTGESPVYLIITCEHDLHIVTDVLKAKIGIFNAEFVMSAVMKGKMDFDLTRSITTV